MEVKMKGNLIKNLSNVKFIQNRIKIIIEKGNEAKGTKKIEIKGVVINNPIPVTIEFSHMDVIAFAEVSIENDCLVASFELDIKKYGNLYPAIGFITKRSGEVDAVSECNLKIIGLSINKNCDESILSINEQLKVQ